MYSCLYFDEDYAKVRKNSANLWRNMPPTLGRICANLRWNSANFFIYFAKPFNLTDADAANCAKNPDSILESGSVED